LFGPLAAALGPLVSTLPVIGPALAALLPIIGALIDGLKPVSMLIGAFSEGLSLLVTNGLSQFVEALGFLADPIRNLLAAVGLLIGSALRPLVVMFSAMVSVVAVVIEAFAFVVTVLSPFVEMIVQLFLVLWSGGGNLILAMMGIFDATNALGRGVWSVVGAMQDAAMWLNNSIVKLIRGMGFKGFGKILKDEDSEIPIEYNTNALEANTEAVKDFTREFRNMPSNYKVNRSIFNASSAELNRPDLSEVPGAGSFTRQRWRT